MVKKGSEIWQQIEKDSSTVNLKSILGNTRQAITPDHLIFERHGQ